jgi:hypothetical protein
MYACELPGCLLAVPLKKGKPVERQGRKVSDLRVKTYDSGAARTGFRPPFFIDIREEENTMLPAADQSISEVYFAAPAALCCPHKTLPPCSSCSATSPKTHELRTRYEARHVAELALELSRLDHDI